MACSQWQACAQPDPDQLQYNQMIKACEQLALSADYLFADPKKVYIFCDVGRSQPLTRPT